MDQPRQRPSRRHGAPQPHLNAVRRPNNGLKLLCEGTASGPQGSAITSAAFPGQTDFFLKDAEEKSMGVEARSIQDDIGLFGDPAPIPGDDRALMWLRPSPPRRAPTLTRLPQTGWGAPSSSPTQRPRPRRLPSRRKQPPRPLRPSTPPIRGRGQGLSRQRTRGTPCLRHLQLRGGHRRRCLRPGVPSQRAEETLRECGHGQRRQDCLHHSSLRRGERPERGQGDPLLASEPR